MIIIKNKKLLLTLSTFLIVFLFTGCYLFNLPPVIESDPETTAKEGVAYTYEVETTDPNGDPARGELGRFARPPGRYT